MTIKYVCSDAIADFLSWHLGAEPDMRRDTHCATCQELVIRKSYLASLTNATCFYFKLEIILNRFDIDTGKPQVPT